MAQMNIESTAGWSYNGKDVVAPICTFKNPSNTEKAEIYSVTLYLGTVRGTCTAGDHAYGDGGSFDTYVSIEGQKSEWQPITNVIGVISGSTGTYPNYEQMTQAYTFRFSSAVVIPAGTNATISIKTPSTANSKVLALNGKTTFSNGSPISNGKQITVEYANVPNIAPKPTNVFITCTDYTAERISWKAGCSGSVTNYKVYLDDVVKYNQNTTANSITSSFINVSSSWHHIRVEVKNSNSEWVSSNTVYVDCTIPPIEDPNIQVTTTNKGILKFTSTYDVRYFLDGTALGSVKANTNPQKTVTLKNNTISNYVLKVARSDNNKIENSRTIKNVDSTVAKITLTVNAQGGANYVVTADKECSSWTYTITDSNNEVQKTYTISTPSGARQINGSLSNLELNKKYYMQFKATTKSSGLEAKSNICPFELSGGAQINTSDSNNASWKSAIPYVYDNGKWNQLIPYIWDGTEWVVCS